MEKVSEGQNLDIKFRGEEWEMEIVAAKSSIWLR